MKHIVAIDGPAGAGKSSVSRAVARELGWRYVDTGAMYRIIGVLADQKGIAVDDEAALAALCDQTEMEFREVDGEVRVFGDGREVTREIRTAAAGPLASRVSALPAVRERLVALQRRMAEGGSVVMEGRDIGTVVCPDAMLKIFLDASPRERAERRAAELTARGEVVDIDRMEQDIAERDARDSGRSHSPMKAAADAVVVDTTGVALPRVISEIVGLARQRARP